MITLLNLDKGLGLLRLLKKFTRLGERDHAILYSMNKEDGNWTQFFDVVSGRVIVTDKAGSKLPAHS